MYFILLSIVSVLEETKVDIVLQKTKFHYDFLLLQIVFCNVLETVEWDIIIKILLKIWRRKEENEDEKFLFPCLMPIGNYSIPNGNLNLY